MNKNDLENGKSYAKCAEISKRIRWDIDKDVIRGRDLDFDKKFLPDTVSRVNELVFLQGRERVVLSQIQGRTYAHMFGLVERFITAHTLKLANRYWLGDQSALRALVGFGEEELKHQELFARLEEMTASSMPAGYSFIPDSNRVAEQVLDKSPWTVLALTCLIEHFTQSHYRESMAADIELSELFKDVFLFHWREESQHTIIDELEWRRIDQQMSNQERDQAVDELIELVRIIDGALVEQSVADSEYFFSRLDRTLHDDQRQAVRNTVLAAYRWQFIESGIEQPRFSEIFYHLIDDEQKDRVTVALAKIKNNNKK